MTPAEVLERAAVLIEERGLWKGGYAEHKDGSGSVCALGAIRVATYGTAFPFMPGNPDLTVAAKALAKQIDPLSEYRLIEWNDAEQRTAADVTSTMRAVATTLRAQSTVTPELVTA